MKVAAGVAAPPPAALVVVDVQGRLAEVVEGSDRLMAEIRRLILGWRALGLPVLWTEQVPDKLGPTRTEIAEALSGIPAIPKAAFSCAGEPAFMQALGAARVRRVLLCGIEAHVCICFVALKVYKELERMLKVSEIKMSVDKVLALAKTITTIQIRLPLNKDTYTQTMLMARHQKIAKLFDEDFWGTQ